MICPNCGHNISNKAISRHLGSRGGKAGGSRGGRALMAKFTPAELSERNRKIAIERWAKIKKTAVSS